MKKERIIITDCGNVTIPSEVRMAIPEIADLFGIFYQTAKREIRTIEKSGVASGDLSLDCTAEGNNIYPVFYGLDMIIALVFRVQSPKTNIFRKWIMKKTTRNDVTATLVLSLQNASLN